jgi:hypothetical protein
MIKKHELIPLFTLIAILITVVTNSSATFHAHDHETLALLLLSLYGVNISKKALES